MIETALTGLGISLKGVSPNDFLVNAHWFDWGTVFLVFLGTAYGASKGLWREFVKMFWILFLIYIVMEIHPKVGDFLHVKANMESKFAGPAGYLIALSLTFLSILLVDSYLVKTMHTTVIPVIKILGGIAFGFVNSLMVLGLLTTAVYLWPFYGIKKFFQKERSYIAYRTVEIVPTVYEYLQIPVDAMRASVKKISEKDDAGDAAVDG